jgi:hypothetical protein
LTYDSESKSWVSPEITVKPKVSETSNSSNQAFIPAVGVATKTMAKTIPELLEGTGVSLTKNSGFGWGPSSLTVGMIFSPYEAGRGSNLPVSNIINQVIKRQFGEYSSERADYILSNSKIIPTSFINEYNKRNNDKIVFRYMSYQEAFFNGGYSFNNINRYLNFTNKFITPDMYSSSSAAKTFLQLPNAPDIAIWTFESQIQATKIPSVGWKKVEGNPQWGVGGGNEAIISQPFPAKGSFLLTK